MNLNKAPTPYEVVNSMVQILFEESHKILGDNILGMYLQGSLATGDFNIKSSDIDFIFVLHKKLTKEEIKEIQKMREDMVEKEVPEDGHKRSKTLDGSYVQKDLFKYSGLPEEGRDHMNGDGFGAPTAYGYEWIFEKYILSNHSVIVMGPHPRTFIKPVSGDEIVGATVGFFNKNLKPCLVEDLSDSYKQAHGVLTMCRVLLTLREKKEVSKVRAARWTQKNFNRWDNLIEDALDWVNEYHNPDHREFNRSDDVKDFIRFTIEYSEKYRRYKSNNILNIIKNKILSVISK